MLGSQVMTAYIESAPLVGIFAGGEGRRMGGIDKGSLQIPGSGESIVEHHAALAKTLGLPCVLLGARSAWSSRLPQYRILADEPSGVGPLGGLHALLQAAQEGPAIALACDMPYINAELLTMLCNEPHGPSIVAPKDHATGKWQPLFARYESRLVLPALRTALAAGQRSFQALFETLQVQELVLPAALAALLRDWDRPEDLEDSSV